MRLALPSWLEPPSRGRQCLLVLQWLLALCGSLVFWSDKVARRSSKHRNLPPRMRARVQRSGKTYYYYDAGGRPRKEIPLGPDFVEAVRQWCDLDMVTTEPH